MARRPSATTAALLFLLLSILAVAQCRPLETDPATDGESASAVAAGGDGENGFLHLPSHRIHRHHNDHRHGDGAALSHLSAMPLALPAEEKAKAVAEPDPNRSLPDEGAAVRAWKKEMRGRGRGGHDEEEDAAEGSKPFQPPPPPPRRPGRF
ncbi:unnamed protein product [Urochloa humidicola]